VFATLAGGLPIPPTEPDPPDASETRGASKTPGASETRLVRLRRLVDDQRATGLEPIGDGLLDWPEGSVVGTARVLGGQSRPARVDPAEAAGSATRVRFQRPPVVDVAAAVERYRELARLAAPAAVKVVLGGPISIATLAAEVPSERNRLAHALAEALNAVLGGLEAAGCPLVQIDEPALTTFRAPSEGRWFVEVHGRLLAGVARLHPSLAVLGGSAEAIGAATLFEPPYRSYLFDLIDGPDNWRLVVDAPGDRGVVCGVVPTGPSLGPVNREVLVYAAHCAAATQGRGLARVGLATAGSLAGLPYAEAVARMRLLAAGAAAAEAAASGTAEATRERLDPRSWDLRAGGRPVPVRPVQPVRAVRRGRGPARGSAGSS